MEKNKFFSSVYTLTFSRLIINITRRFPYPFVAAIARRLGVSPGSVQSVLAVQAGVGVTSPVFGTLSERYGHKRVIIGVLLMMTLVSVLGVLLPQFWIFALVIVAYGVGKMIFDPAMQAYIGEHIPYTRRAQAIGITELSWAGAMIVAAPVAGFLLEASGLQAIFALLTVALFIATIVTMRYLPPDESPGRQSTNPINPLAAWRIIRQSPAGMGAMAYSLLLVAANEIFFINYSIWMEESFDLVLTALGTVTVVIAIAEITGESIVIGVADRFGKRRVALLGAICSSLSYLMLPYLSFSLPVTLAGLFVMFISVELAIVSSIPMFTEILPDSRAVMMSGNVGAHSLGRMIGAGLGGFLYATTHNFQLMGGVAAVIGLGAAVILWRMVQEQS